MAIPKNPNQLIRSMQNNSKLAAYMFVLFQKEREKVVKPVDLNLTFRHDQQV